MSRSTSPRVRADFPILEREVHGQAHRLPRLGRHRRCSPHAVIEAMGRYYERPTPTCTAASTRSPRRPRQALRAARGVEVARFVGAPGSRREVVFTKNATEAINLLATHGGAANLREGDAVVLIDMEHHANIVPWQMLRGRARHRDALDPDRRRRPPRPRRTSTSCSTAPGSLSVTAMSNVLGHHQPRRASSPRPPTRPARWSHVDGAQAVPHFAIDVQASTSTSSASPATRCWGPPASACSWARAELLESMPPVPRRRRHDPRRRTERLPARGHGPQRFEAGTPPIAEAVGLTAAVEYLERLGMDDGRAPTRHGSPAYALERLVERFGDSSRRHGPPRARGSWRRALAHARGRARPRRRPGPRPVRRLRAARATTAPSR